MKRNRKRYEIYQILILFCRGMDQNKKNGRENQSQEFEYGGAGC